MAAKCSASISWPHSWCSGFNHDEDAEGAEDAEADAGTQLQDDMEVAATVAHGSRLRFLGVLCFLCVLVFGRAAA